MRAAAHQVGRAHQHADAGLAARRAASTVVGNSAIATLSRIASPACSGAVSSGSRAACRAGAQLGEPPGSCPRSKPPVVRSACGTAHRAPHRSPPFGPRCSRGARSCRETGAGRACGPSARRAARRCGRSTRPLPRPDVGHRHLAAQMQETIGAQHAAVAGLADAPSGERSRPRRRPPRRRPRSRPAANPAPW